VINAIVTDPAVLAARTPSDLAMYLRSQQWRLDARNGIAARWTKVVGDDEFEVAQPLDSDLRDYASRVHDVVETLALVERRSELDILDHLSRVSTDVHLVRIFPADEAPGMIGLDDGVQAYESLRGLVTAAAYSVGAKQPRAVQPARKPTEFLEYLRGVRIGPSAAGSFVLSMHTPVPPKLSTEPPSSTDAPEIDEPLAEPFERQVSLRIYDAVRAAYQAANAALVDPDGLAAFTEGVASGISANLCEALVGLAGPAAHPLELSMMLAPSRPSRRRPTPIRFRRDHFAVLESAAAELRARSAEEDSVVVGNVVRLYRESSAGTGEVSIAGTVDGEDRLRRIWVELAGDDYETAVRAHTDMRLVSVQGDIVRRGTRSYLTRPSKFRMLPDLAG
jgi:hypothetical protein